MLRLMVKARRAFGSWLAARAGLASRAGHTFNASLLGRGSMFVDLGAYKGEFARALVADFGCRGCCVEADPELFAQLPKNDEVCVLHAALGGRDGKVTLYLAEKREANSLDPRIAEYGGARGSVVVESLTLQSCLAKLGVDHVDLLKVDIEGAEIVMLDSAPESVLRRIRQVTIEFHDFVLAQKYGPDVSRVRARLCELGFMCLIMDDPAHWDVLFIQRSEAARLPFRKRLLLEFIRDIWLPLKRLRRQLAARESQRVFRGRVTESNRRNDRQSYS
jgi:FkbM family methyltransferase